MYEGLCDRYIFQAIAIETSYVFGRDTNAFISRLGHLTTSISGDVAKLNFSANVYHLQQSVETEKRQICDTSWPPKLLNWDCLVLYVICTLLSLHYVCILFMFINTMSFHMFVCI